MSPSEYEQLLHDAGVKLARLKALYEQYFQGIEKVEPTVPRKDLDRQMEFLRKNQPRNTALRFRFQMLLAKYGSYQTYWQRIARQIEEGTYRRDVMRAQQRRLRAQADQMTEAPAIDVSLEVEPLDAGTLAFDDTDVEEILGALAPSTEPAPQRRSLTPFAGAPQRRPQPSPAPAGTGTVPPPGSADGRKPVVSTSAKPFASFAKPKGEPTAPQEAVSSAREEAKTDPAPPPVATPPFEVFAVPRPAPVPGAAFAGPPVPSPGGPSPVRSGAPAVPSGSAGSGRPVVPPPPVRSVAPAVASPPGPPPMRPGAPAVPSGSAGSGRPVVPPPAGTRATSPSNGTHSAATGSVRADDLVDDVKLRRIYESFVEARRRNNERTDVKFETLAQSVRQMLPKLREKHGDRPIDFEVVVHNGKVGLKPKVGP
jgi:hypothetical protein